MSGLANTIFYTNREAFSRTAIEAFRAEPSWRVLSPSQWGGVQSVLLRCGYSPTLPEEFQRILKRQTAKAAKKEQKTAEQAFNALLRLLEEIPKLSGEIAKDDLLAQKIAHGAQFEEQLRAQLNLVAIHELFERLVKLARIFETENGTPVLDEAILKDFERKCSLN